MNQDELARRIAEARRQHPNDGPAGWARTACAYPGGAVALAHVQGLLERGANAEQAARLGLKKATGTPGRINNRLGQEVLDRGGYVKYTEPTGRRTWDDLSFAERAVVMGMNPELVGRKPTSREIGEALGTSTRAPRPPEATSRSTGRPSSVHPSAYQPTTSTP